MSNNGVAVTLPIGAVKGLANYPRGRLAPATVHRALDISGTSSRRPNGTFAGARANPNSPRMIPTTSKRRAGETAAGSTQATNDKGGLGSIIDATVFLVDMKRDHAGMNGVWNRFWPRLEEAPARTTVGARDLPGEEMAVEVKRAAVVEGGEQWDDRSDKRRRLAERSSVLGRQPGSIPGQLLRLVFCLRDGRIPPFHSSHIDELGNRHLG
ncbi:2-aminomuconate deaminase [Colletotrichum liriopes]|uniref:2-aminomuconate deaminase n=1 Tax=Colletotrichum liriopes TaxID=708192 RepID=A0AA37GTS6_9PEZI|nr:2-aminomuconate deaminase [Colletotrichum liriopes]